LKVLVDIETRSHADLPAVGAYRYAKDPTTEILMCAVTTATPGDPVYLWVNPKYEDAGVQSDPEALALMEQADLVYAHNAPFEQPVMAATGFQPEIPLAKWRCTMAMARMAGLPESLDKCAKMLELEAQKDARGKALIRLFSLPQDSGTFVEPASRPEEWKEFCEYCRRDVEVEREIYNKLKGMFDFQSINLKTWLFTLRMNEVGIPVNVPALTTAKRIIDEVSRDAIVEFRGLTGLNLTQRDKVRAWLQNESGIRIPDMQADTLAELREMEISRRAKRAVELYIQLSFAAVKKVSTMLDWQCNGRIHGVFKFYGTGTGRWSAGGPQIQNVKKPTPAMRPITREAYAALCDGVTAAEMNAVYGDPIEVIASCIRHFVHIPGVRMLDADYNAIEARIACWLGGEKEALQAYVEGRDRYRAMAAKIFGVPEKQVTSDQRDLGKQAILGLSYGMGMAKFASSCEQRGMTIDSALAERAVKTFRVTHPGIQRVWKVLDGLCQDAVRHKYSQSTVVRFGNNTIPMGVGIEYLPGTTKFYLTITLPSGRKLAYLDPSIMAGELTYWGQLPMAVAFGRIKLYGAKIFENICQAIAADLMSHGAQTAEDEWMQPFALIHDQALAIHSDGVTPDQFASALQSLPPWAAGLPLKAEAKSVPYYAK
jgi:DNA polymerase